MTDTPAPAASHHAPLASWPSRAGAVILDQLLPAIVWVVAIWQFGETSTQTGEASASASFTLTGAPFLVTLLLVLAWGAYNWWYRQGTTGQTLGKTVMRIAVFDTGTTDPTGVPRSIGRYFARFLDAAPCYLGLLWPLWDKENRTFSDMMVGTRVYRVREEAAGSGLSDGR